MNNLPMKIKIQRIVLLFVLVVALVACGGGISGSGNGGGSPSPGLPSIGYNIEHLPPHFAAAIPASLLVNVAQTGSTAPVGTLSHNMVEVAEFYLNFGLVQLYADAAWPQIQEFCEGVVTGVACDFGAAGISLDYTRDMAIWESSLRFKIYGPLADGEGVVDDENEDILLHPSAITKIGTTIELTRGAYQQHLDGEYRYEVSLGLPGAESGGLVYRLLWNEEIDLVQAVVSGDDSTLQSHFRSIYRPSSDEKDESQQVILAYREADGQQNEIQFNQFQFPDQPDVVYLESQSRIVDSSGKTEIYSRGQADSMAGFLFSETISEDTQSSIDVELHREVFGSEGDSNAHAVCDFEVSLDKCATQQDWNLLNGSEPTESNYYLPQSQLDELGNELRLFDLTIQNVETGADSYLLLARDNLTISFTAAGIQITLPGLGSFSWPPTQGDDLSVASDTTPESIAALDSSFLCRVIPPNEVTAKEFRAYCSGPEEELAGALVISEFYEEGEFRIQWEADAEIIFNNRP